MKNGVKTVLGIIIGTILFIMLCKGLDYLYVTYDPWNRILFNSYYSQDNIDNLFVGSSHVYCDIIPEVIDEKTQQNNFNLSTPAQRMDVSYYLIKDAISNNNIQNVYIECYYNVLTERKTWMAEEKQYKYIDMIDNPSYYSRKWMLTYAMRPSLSCFQILSGTVKPDHVMESFFPFVRYRENLFDWDQIKKNMEDKSSTDYDDFKYSEIGQSQNGEKYLCEYRDKGFQYTDGIKLYDDFKTAVRGSNGHIGEKSEYYLRKTIEYCQDNNIGVTLFVSPMYPLGLISLDDYDEYLDELRGISNDYDVKLYDFNLVKDDFLCIKDNKYFLDISHLNTDGAELFSPALATVITSSEEENAGRFYNTFEEKSKNVRPQIFGLSCEYTEPSGEFNGMDQPQYIKADYIVVSNRDDMEYKVLKAVDKGGGNEEGEIEMIQDYDSNDRFVLPIDECGTLYIYGRYGDDELNIALKYGYE